MKKYIDKKIVKKVIMLSVIIGIGILGINYTFCYPTTINAYVAANVYSEPANSYFDDDNFYRCVVKTYNSKNGTNIAYTTSLSDEQLHSINSLSCNNSNILSANGLSKLTALKSLSLNGNKLTQLDLSKNTELTDLSIYSNQLTELNLSNNTKLTDLNISHNYISAIDLSRNTELIYMGANGNNLSTIDLSNNIELTRLILSSNNLISLDVSKNVKLVELDVDGSKVGGDRSYGPNVLTALNLSNNLELTHLNVSHNKLTELDLSKNTLLTHLDIDNNNLTSIDVSNNKLLERLCAYNNQNKQLDISNNVNLIYVSTGSDYLMDFNISKNIKLQELFISNSNLKSFDASNNLNLTSLRIENSNLGSIDVSKNNLLKSLELRFNNIAEIDLKNNVNLESLDLNYNLLNNIDVSANPKLTYLGLSENKLTKLDISNNKNLKTLYIDGNLFQNKIIIYKNEEINLLDNPFLTFPENLSYSFQFVSDFSDKLNGGKIIFDEIGNKKFTSYYHHNIAQYSISGLSFRIGYDVYVLEATSDKYEINVKDGYIYTNTDVDDYTILNNISLNYGEASIEDDKLLIKYEGEIIKEFDIVSISSNEYDLSKDYIYTGTQMFDIENIDVLNGIKEVKDNKLLVKYKEEILKEFDIVSILSDEYDLTKYYIYTGTQMFDIENIDVLNGIKEVKDDKLLIKYNDYVLRQYELISVTIDEYEIIDTGKLYIINKSENEIKNSIKVINAELFIYEDKIEIKKENTILDDFKVYKINFSDELKLFEKNIIVSKNTSYNEFINNVTISDGLTYKLFDGDDEFIAGIIDKQLILKIYYNEKEIDYFNITNEYLIIDKSIGIDEDNMYFNNIDFNTIVETILNKIDTTGEVTIKNKDNEVITSNDLIGTGSIVSIKLSKETYEYTVIIHGDVDGDGVLKLSDIMKIANYTYKNKNSLLGVFELAADFDNNGNHNLQDIMKSAKALYG